MNETELAASIAAGTTPSPQQLAGFWLAALRVTGTGCAYRNALKEGVFRDPPIYLTPQFLARCNGLPIIAEHQDGTLDGPEFEARVLGSVVLPYIANSDGIQNEAGDEVWGVGRIYDGDVVAAITADPSNPLSTSPCVVFGPGDGNEHMELPSGEVVLIEGNPSLLCSLAITPNGVWDKGMVPHGIRVDSEKDKAMTDEEQTAADKAKADKAKKDAEGNTDETGVDKLLAKLSSIMDRLDSLEQRGKGETTEETESREDAARRDRGRSTLTAKDMDRQRAEESQMMDSQAMADPAYQSWGLRAPAPMAMENPLDYRRRVLRGLQPHSVQFRDSDLAILSQDAKTFDVVERTIYADAVQASKNPIGEDGRRTKRVHVDDETGQRVVTWHGGEGSTIFRQFAQPSMRVTKFHIPTGARAA
jgi:colicin import membrane protein